MLAVTTLVFFPSTNYDPFNLPKFFVLTIFIVLLVGITFLNRPINAINHHKKSTYFLLIFFVWMIISTIISEANSTQKLFGIYGRQTGLITFTSLTLLMWITMLNSSRLLTQKILQSLTFSGVIAGLYGLIQFAHRDPFNWQNPYSRVFGPMGNPNFHSAHMALVAVVSIASILHGKRDLKSRLIHIFTVVLSLMNIYATKSLQGGIIVGVIGLMLMSTVQHSNFAIKKINNSFRSLIGVAIIYLVLDVLQKTPWPPLFYKESVSIRGDLWRSAGRIFLDNPIFGIGLDEFRDYYRSYRDVRTLNHSTNLLPADSTHNYFLDLLIGGGIPLALIYLGFQIYVFKIIRKLLANASDLKVPIYCVSAVWLAFTLQSLISPGQIGLLIWGWAVSGLIIGLDKIDENTTLRKPTKELDLKGNFAIVSLLLFITGAILIQPVLNDSKFFFAVKSNDKYSLMSSVQRWPMSSVRLVSAAKILRFSGDEENGLLLAKKAIKFNDRYYEGWLEVYLNNLSSEEDKKLSLKKLIYLNPLITVGELK